MAGLKFSKISIEGFIGSASKIDPGAGVSVVYDLGSVYFFYEPNYQLASFEQLN